MIHEGCWSTSSAVEERLQLPWLSYNLNKIWAYTLLKGYKHGDIFLSAPCTVPCHNSRTPYFRCKWGIVIIGRNITETQGSLRRLSNKDVDKRWVSSTQTKFRSSNLDQIVCFISFQFKIYKDYHSITYQKAVLTRKYRTEEWKISSHR